jgi:hypothetical protein
VLDSLTLPSGEADAGEIEAAPCCQMCARACASAGEFVYWRRRQERGVWTRKRRVAMGASLHRIATHIAAIARKD